jgi:predicted RNA-binding Zn-ribbon protein involved in translation (DUF1610 family)
MSTAEAPKLSVDNYDCPNCGTHYRMVRVEADPDAHAPELTCLSCGAPMMNRHGRFALKYFRVTGRRRER